LLSFRPILLFWLLVLSLLISNVSALEMERPSITISIDSREDIAGTDDEASVGLGVHVMDYRETFYTGGRDGVALRLGL